MSSPVVRYNQQFQPKEPETVSVPVLRVQNGDWDFASGMDRAREIIALGGLDVIGEKVNQSGDHVFMLRHCVFNPDHANNDAAIMVSPEGKLKYHCFHNSRSDKTWQDVRDFFGFVSKRQQESSVVSICHRESATDSDNHHVQVSASTGHSESVCDQSLQYRTKISNEVYNYICQAPGTFNVFDLDRELCYSSRADRNARASALNRYKKQGFIIQSSSKRGHWRIVDKECKGMKLGSAKTKPLPIALPLGLHELCDIRPGNIIVVAGSPNAGKSAYVSNLIHLLFNNNTFGDVVSSYAESIAAEMAKVICPGQKLECHFFSSEAGEDEMSSRLMLHPGGIDAFNDVNFWERDRDFADVIRPNAINVIDFLEVYEDFFQIGAWINDIHRALDRGIAVIVIQKKRGRDVGKGGDVTMEKPRLYISLENNAPFGGICKVIKAKFPKNHHKNPNGLEIDYRLIDGHDFRARSDWRYVEDEKARKRINRDYEAEASERHYMFNFMTVEGEIKGLTKSDVEKWIAACPRIYVIGHLEKIEHDSKEQPFLTSKSWFFTVSNMLSKLNSKQVRES